MNIPKKQKRERREIAGEVLILPTGTLSLPRVRANLPTERAFEMSDSEELAESLQPPQETPFESDGGWRTNSAEPPMPEPRSSPPEDWRELAQRVQVESDPKKMFKLVEQLIAKIDEERLQIPDYRGNRGEGLDYQDESKALG
jgi:hypothetical protein